MASRMASKIASRTCRVLVADHDADVRNVVEDLLFDQDFEVRQAESTDDAVLELRQGAFDVVLCHLQLLRSGNGLLARCTRELQPALRVVAMSSAGAQARTDEADENLAKPFTRSQLLAALRPS
jgi:DNA-binding NtrC family response regulator